MQSGAYVILQNLREDLLASNIAIVLIPSTCNIWPLTILKSRYLGQNFSINKFLLFIRCLDIYKSKYHISWVDCIIILDFFTMLAISRQKNLILELSSAAAAAIWVRFFRARGFLLVCLSLFSFTACVT